MSKEGKEYQKKMRARAKGKVIIKIEISLNIKNPFLSSHP
jgi:hypothetical protein